MPTMAQFGAFASQRVAVCLPLQAKTGFSGYGCCANPWLTFRTCALSTATQRARPPRPKSRCRQWPQRSLVLSLMMEWVHLWPNLLFPMRDTRLTCLMCPGQRTTLF